MGVTLLVFPGGEAALRPKTLVHPHPKIQHRDNIDGIPLNAKSEWCLAEVRWYKSSAFTLYFL